MQEKKFKSFEEAHEEFRKNMIIVDSSEFPDLRNDPAFKKKNDDAREFLRKHPIPKSMLGKSK